MWFSRWLAPMPKSPAPKPPTPTPAPTGPLPAMQPRVKLYGPDGQHYGIVTRDQALDEAVDNGWDIEVMDPNPFTPTWHLRRVNL